MKTVGLVVEYNPLHNGHKYHFQQAKKTTNADACIIVMSGNFLQRGEPAVVSKWARTEMALQLGIDLVVELPVPFATATAEIFALGAVSILDRLGVVDSICFGSESGDLSWMQSLAKALVQEPVEFTSKLKEGLSEGFSYPTAYAEAATHYMRLQGFENVALDQPNNILGLQYLLAIERLQSPMEAVTIIRQKAGYHQTSITDQAIASATALRKLLVNDGAPLDDLTPFVPPTTLAILRQEFAQGAGPLHWESFKHPLFHRLLQLTSQEFAQYHEVEEGIENRIKQMAKAAGSVHDLLTASKTKRFTWNRLQRILLAVLLDLRKDTTSRLQLKQGAPYARVLGFSEKGRVLLHEAKKKSSIPIYTNIRDGLHPMLDLDITASSLYRLAMPQQGMNPFTEEYLRQPLRNVSAQAPSSMK